MVWGLEDLVDRFNVLEDGPSVRLLQCHTCTWPRMT